jgi:hypothetical protein
MEEPIHILSAQRCIFTITWLSIWQGKKMTAADVAYSLARIIDKNTASPAHGFLIIVLIRLSRFGR